jgi:hypothetical protein
VIGFIYTILSMAISTIYIVWICSNYDSPIINFIAIFSGTLLFIGLIAIFISFRMRYWRYMFILKHRKCRETIKHGITDEHWRDIKESILAEFNMTSLKWSNVDYICDPINGIYTISVGDLKVDISQESKHRAKYAISIVNYSEKSDRNDINFDGKRSSVNKLLYMASNSCCQGDCDMSGGI